MKKILSAALCLVIALWLTGCADMMATKEGKGTLLGAGIGTAIGAGIGNLVGHDSKSTAIGAASGALVGAGVGKYWGRYLQQQEDELNQRFADVDAVQVRRDQDQIHLTFKSDVMFSVGSSTLHPNAAREIARAAEVLVKYPDSIIIIRGHTDSSGSEQTNQQLSEYRAEAVKQQLVDHGVSDERLMTIGYGETEPVADNTTQAGRQMNRRVEVSIAPPEMFEEQS